MKKFSILCLGLTTAAVAVAQTSLVKEVERSLKDPAQYASAMEQLKPAFSNPETMNDAFTYFVAGKGGVDYFDNQQVLVQMGKEVDKKAVGHALVDAFGYFQKALPLDSVPNEKGKIKPKYSKKIMDTAEGHYLDLQNAAVYMYEAQDYPGAVEAWTLFVNGKNNPMVANKAKQYPDSVFGEIYFNMGIANSIAGNHEGSLADFKNAISHGYKKKNAYDYGISEAAQLQKPEEMAVIAEEAYNLFGKEDSRYIGYIINNYIDKKQYAEANALIDKYIALQPNDSQLYFVKGVLCDAEGKSDECISNLRKAIELDESNARALLQLGYQICKKADDIDQVEGGGLSNADYAALQNNKIFPLYKEAATYLEKAYSIDNELDDARKMLRSIYYKVNDEENLKRIEAL